MSTVKDDAKMFESAGTEEFTSLYEKTMPMLYRLCYSFVKNRDDTQDLVHGVFVKFMQCGKTFDSEEHQKAWLIVTARNLCKNHLRHWWRKTEALSSLDGALFDVAPQHGEVTEAVLNLPEKYKTPVFLYYYEGYDTNEIANILQKNSSTVRRQLAEARALLGGVLSEKV